MWRRQVVVEKVIIPILRALKDPREQIWFGIALATLLAAIFASSGGGMSAPTTASAKAQVASAQATSPHQTPHSGPFALFKPGPPKLIPGSRPLDSGTLPKEPEKTHEDDFGVFH